MLPWRSLDMALVDVVANPRVLGAALSLAVTVAGASGYKAISASDERDDALARAHERQIEDIKLGYSMCQGDTQKRVDRNEERIIPLLPEKKIARAATLERE